MNLNSKLMIEEFTKSISDIDVSLQEINNLGKELQNIFQALQNSRQEKVIILNFLNTLNENTNPEEKVKFDLQSTKEEITKIVESTKEVVRELKTDPKTGVKFFITPKKST